MRYLVNLHHVEIYICYLIHMLTVQLCLVGRKRCGRFRSRLGQAKYGSWGSLVLLGSSECDVGAMACFGQPKIIKNQKMLLKTKISVPPHTDLMQKPPKIAFVKPVYP